MGINSKIEWTHHTFNPWRGCTKATWTDSTGKVRLHPGCLNCYAEVDRSVRIHGIRWGKGQPRKPRAESGWAEPLAWTRAAVRAGERHRVFCASLADVLDPEVPDTWRERLWDTIRQTAFAGDSGPDEDPREVGYPSGPPDPWARSGLDWLLLTKRPEEWRRVPEDVRPLVWLGTSIADQASADAWVPRLLDAEGFRFRFLSAEPLVGPVDLSRFLKPVLHTNGGERLQHPDPRIRCEGGEWEWDVSWVVVGGESGSKARPCDVAWIRSVVRQCRETAVPVFVKQLGACASDPENGLAGAALKLPDVAAGLVTQRLTDKKGGNWEEWPADLRVREFPMGSRRSRSAGSAPMGVGSGSESGFP